VEESRRDPVGFPSGVCLKEILKVKRNLTFGGLHFGISQTLSFNTYQSKAFGYLKNFQMQSLNNA
jgi:hypothetical protein